LQSFYNFAQLIELHVSLVSVRLVSYVNWMIIMSNQKWVWLFDEVGVETLSWNLRILWKVLRGGSPGYWIYLQRDITNCAHKYDARQILLN